MEDLIVVRASQCNHFPAPGVLSDLTSKLGHEDLQGV